MTVLKGELNEFCEVWGFGNSKNKQTKKLSLWLKGSNHLLFIGGFTLTSFSKWSRYSRYLSSKTEGKEKGETKPKAWNLSFMSMHIVLMIPVPMQIFAQISSLLLYLPADHKFLLSVSPSPSADLKAFHYLKKLVKKIWSWSIDEWSFS